MERACAGADVLVCLRLGLWLFVRACVRACVGVGVGVGVRVLVRA